MDAENELFDAACEVLDAARRLRAAADLPRLRRVVPGTLGCLEAAIDELAASCEALEREVPPERRAALADAADVLHRAGRACDNARVVTSGGADERRPAAPR